MQKNLLRVAGACLAVILDMSAQAQGDGSGRVGRLAKLQIDPAQLESYKAALKEGVETALRVERGVLTLYPVAEKNNPTHITILEIYANAEAYESHLQTPHFLKYKATTKDMVKSLELIETI